MKLAYQQRTIKRTKISITQEELYEWLQITLPKNPEKLSARLRCHQDMNSIYIRKDDGPITIDIEWEEPI